MLHILTHLLNSLQLSHNGGGGCSTVREAPLSFELDQMLEGN